MYGIDANTFMNAVILAILGATALLLVVTGVGAWLGKRGRAMSYLYMFTALFGTFAIVVVVLGFRGARSGERPWHILLDMKYQAKYTSQGQSKYFADGRSSRLPPADTIPFDGTDYTADAGAHDGPNPDFLKADRRYYSGIANPDAKAKAEDGTESPVRPKWEGGRLVGEGYWVNNLPPLAVERAGGWDALLKRGRVQFDRNCAVCHGTSGRGGRGELAHGIIGAYGLSSEPANLVAPKPGTGVPSPPAPAQPDGQLFDTITHGRGTMPGYGHQVRDVLDRWAIVAYLRELQFAYEPPAGGK